MKRFLGTRIATIIITVLVCTIVMAGAAFAANFSKALPAEGNVVTANPDLAFYSDSACTQVITTLGFGDVVQGDTSAVDVYIKNVGNKNLTSVTGTSDLSTEVGTINYSLNNFQVAKGANTKVTITFAPKIGGTFGPVTPTITYSGSY